MRRDARKRRNPARLPVPVALPLVVATVQSDETIEVTVDGVMLMQGPIARDALGRVLSAIAEDKQCPIRAEVHEADGQVFADIITPPPPRSRFAAPPVLERLSAPSLPEPAVRHVTAPPPVRSEAPGRSQAPALVEVTGEGFIPGEDVAVAVIVSHTSAGGNGTARALLDHNRLPQDADGVVLFGEISGTTIRLASASS